MRYIRTKWSRLLMVAPFIAICLLAPSSAHADPRAELTITVIHAKKGPPFLHNDLKPMWKILKKTFLDKYGYFNMVQRRTSEVANLGRTGVKMPDGRRFTAIYKGITPNKGLLRIAIEYGDFRTKVRIHDGGLFFQAGRRYKGGVLLVAVHARLLKE
ncbi:MAG: hypothetical protein GXP54_04390 [Deltaproteobacteria bacterium]|nr:hypothetical protein [Deltaproteobacteria bacterium]